MSDGTAVKQLRDENDFSSIVKWSDSDVQEILSLSAIDDFSDVNALVFDGCKFHDSVWDFSKYNVLQITKGFFIYDFKKIQPQYRNYAKVLMLYQWYVEGQRPSTSKNQFNKIVTFCNFLKEKHVYSPKFISVNIVKEFFDKQTCREKGLAILKTKIRYFLMEIEARNEDVSYRAIYDEILNVVDLKLIRAESEGGKIPLIPDNTFKKIVSLGLKDIYNTELDILSRMAACMVIILSETGMRIGEFALLQINQLEELKLNDEYEVFHYLHFKTYKTTGTRNWIWTKTFMTEKAVLAYKTLENLLNSCRKTKYLYVSHFGKKYCSHRTFKLHMRKFFIKHQDELDFGTMSKEELEHFSCITIDENFIKKNAGIKVSDIGKQFFYTTQHQYRVTVCNKLVIKKSLDWVRRHMNHITPLMTEHYIRKAEMRRKQRNQVEIDVLQKRANNTGGQLEISIDTDNEIVKRELSIEELRQAYKDINAFLEKKKLNLFKDIKEILAYMKNRATILVETEEGLCARTAFDKLCKRQEYISSVNDLYYIGPQIIAIEEMEFTYKRFKEKTQVIKHNEKMFKENSKYKTELERERKSMEKYVEKKVFPEIMALGRAIEEKGEDSVIEKHPNLKSIILNYTKIKDEILKWKSVS